jgi:sugar phosphate permease
VIGVLAPWQITFIVVAAPGFALLLFMPMLSEPARTDTLQLQTSLTLQQLIAMVWERRAVYGAYLLGAPFIVLVLYAFQAWIPSLLVRVHGFGIVDAGRVYGSIALFAGSAGVLSGPLMMKWLRARLDQDGAPLTIAMGAAILLIPVTVIMGLSASPSVAIAMVTAGSFLITVPMALFATGLQNSSPNEIRGLMAGAYVFMVNVVGLTLGPSSVALVTDSVFGRDDAVGLSLAIVCGCALVLAVMLLRQGLGAFKSEVPQR